MRPVQRAAWRLEAMGFSDVSDYAEGKLDWMAAGLPTEGTNAQRPRAGAVARSYSPTCRLDETLGAVQRRVRAADWKACVVVNAERVVLRLLREKELGGDPNQHIAQRAHHHVGRQAGRADHPRGRRARGP